MGHTWLDHPSLRRNRPRRASAGGSRLLAALRSTTASCRLALVERESSSPGSATALSRPGDVSSSVRGLPGSGPAPTSFSVASSRLFSVAAAGDGPSQRLALQALSRVHQLVTSPGPAPQSSAPIQAGPRHVL